MLGYAFCGSFCTHAKAVRELERLLQAGYEIQPIMSETVWSTDTKFGNAAALQSKVEGLCGRAIIHTIVDAEPLGPRMPLEALVISPCTGNTLAKIANGITDTAVCMAAKAHLRSDRTTLISLASNDAMSANLANIASLLLRKNVFFVPMRQDDPKGKPHSLVADFTLLPDSLSCALKNNQRLPLFL